MKTDTYYKPFFTGLKESSINRLVKHMEEHDCGSITAYRSEYTNKENKQRNVSLLSKLLARGYGVTSVRGSYIENYGQPDQREVGEHVFFVVDLKDRKDVKSVLMKLGKEFDQDSILFIPKGLKEGSYLIGLKKDVWPGLNKEYPLPILKRGTSDNEFLTKVKGRPFYFKEQIIKEEYCGNNNTLYGQSMIAKKHWSEISLTD